MAGDNYAVHIRCVLRVIEELIKHLGELVEHLCTVFLHLGGGIVKEHTLREDDIAVFAYADLAGIAHNLNYTLLYLFKYAKAQHCNGLHLVAHFHKLLVCRLEVVGLLTYKQLLLIQKLCLLGYLLEIFLKLLLLKAQLFAEGSKLQLCFLHLALGHCQNFLGVLQVVACYQVLDIGHQHEEKQDKRHSRHHVCI